MLVPQTGNAVEGFCPGAVQVLCAVAFKLIEKKKVAAKKNFIVMLKSESFDIEQTNIHNAA